MLIIIFLTGPRIPYYTYEPVENCIEKHINKIFNAFSYCNNKYLSILYVIYHVLFCGDNERYELNYYFHYYYY